MTTTAAAAAGEPERSTLHRSRDRFHTFLTLSHSSGTVIVGGDLPVLIGPDPAEIEVPPGSGLLEYLLHRTRRGGRVYLTRDGRRLAGVVPADVAESIDTGEGATLPRRRTLDEIRWEQGVEPVGDPAELQGEVLAEAEFAEFYAAVMSARVP